MSKALLRVLLAPLVIYVGLCLGLFVEQRQIAFQPSGDRLAGPPAGSGFESLDVRVPGLGTLEDWWAPPASPTEPTIIFFHGNGADRTDFLEQGRQFHRRGWGVVLASYPGYSGNPGAPTETSLMADARATIDTVAPRVGRIILWGHSLGSGVAARMASEGRGAGLVLESPYTSLTEIAAQKYPWIPVQLLMLDRFDTRSILGSIRSPVLIFHGVDDPIIPFAMGEDIARRLDGRATFVRMDGVGHYPHLRDLSDPVVAWARARHLAP